MMITLLKAVAIPFLIALTTLFNTAVDHKTPNAEELVAPAPCVEINTYVLEEPTGPGGICRALGTVTANGVCKGVLKCGFRDEDIYRIPCCSDFGKASGWCKEESDTPNEN